MTIDYSPGRWIVLTGYSGMIDAFTHYIEQIEAETPAQVRTVATGRWGSMRISKEKIIATFQNKEEAERMVNKIAGIRGERDRRIDAAKKAANNKIAKLLEQPA